MYRLIATDVDGVVKPYYDPVPSELSDLLAKISEKIKIAFLSGRQISWLDGLVNGMGIRLERTILIGEEGAVIWFPDEYKLVYSLNEEYLQRFIRARDSIKRKISDLFGDQVFIPATHVILTIAAGNKFHEADKLIKEIIKTENYNDLINLTYHKMHNVIQVFPRGIDKYVALRIVLGKLNLDEKDVIALGDGLNDIPILRKAGFSIAIGSNEEVIKSSKVHFDDGLTAFKYIVENLLL